MEPLIKNIKENQTSMNNQLIFKSEEHVRHKFINCECGEDVYEDDIGNNTPEGGVQCIACGLLYDRQKLLNEEYPNVREI
jgi:hypothetical protein